MAIFLDTGKIEEIKKYMNMGVLRGVTTNPTILLKSGVKGGKKAIKNRSIEIANIIKPYPQSCKINVCSRQHFYDKKI